MIYYEKHPVSTERRKELRAKGYQIRDLKFAPVGWIDTEKPKRTKKVVNNVDSE